MTEPEAPPSPEGSPEGAHGHDERDELGEFWRLARAHTRVAELAPVTGPGVEGSLVPPAWAFGDSPALADELLALVLAGQKTGTATALVEFRAADEPVPVKGDLSILLDGSGRPAALVRTTAVTVVPFGEVDDEHAAAEGEDDGTLAGWRREHERYWRRVLPTIGEVFSDDLAVVLERFEVLFPDRPEK